MELKDIAPKEATFKIGDKEYEMRLFTALDNIWLTEAIDKEDLSKAFSGHDMKAIARIVFHQLKDKSDFKATEITEIDENGVETKKLFGGWELFASKVIGQEDQVSIYKAMIETVGLSFPETEDSSEDDDSKKK